jgi:hypothetical protein
MQYRFVTPHRAGKWYPSIEAAQRNAAKIGAGFFDDHDGVFYRYPNSLLETRSPAEAPLMGAMTKAIRNSASAIVERASRHVLPPERAETLRLAES